MEKKPRCWCGAELKRAGIGAYPYPCVAQDKEPDATVWQGCENGHSGWCHE